jgi:hypothetical protein
MLHLNQKLLMRSHVSIYKVLCWKLLLWNNFLLCSNRTSHRTKLLLLYLPCFLSRSYMMLISVTDHGWIIPTCMMWNDVKCLLIKLLLVHYYLLLISRASFETSSFAGLLLIKLLSCQSLISMQLLQMLLMLIKRSNLSTTTFYISKQGYLLLSGIIHDAVVLSSLVELVASFFTKVGIHLVVACVVDRILTPRILIDSRAFYT